MTVQLSGDSIFDFITLLGKNPDPDCIDQLGHDNVETGIDSFDRERNDSDAVREQYDVYFSEPHWQ